MSGGLAGFLLKGMQEVAEMPMNKSKKRSSGNEHLSLSGHD